MSSNQERNPASEGRGLTSTHATVLAALFAMVSAIAGAAVTAYFTLETESTKSIALRDIEKAKQEAATKLARQEFETRLIFRAIEGSASEEERTRNLLFFLKAGFLTDPDGKIASLKPDQYPSKPAMDVVVTESDLESDITDVRRRARRTLAVPEAIPQITRLLANNRIHPNYRQVLGAVEALANMPPKDRCAAYKDNPELRRDVETHGGIKEESLAAAAAKALSC